MAWVVSPVVVFAPFVTWVAGRRPPPRTATIVLVAGLVVALAVFLLLRARIGDELDQIF